jgi:DNA modification methylase
MENLMIENNTIYNVNCLDLLEDLKKQSLNVDLIVTSPPYFNAREYSQYDSLNDYMDIMKNVFKGCFEILNESRMCIINISPVLIPRLNRNEQSKRIPLPYYFVPMMEEIGFEFLEDIIWKKPNGSVPNRNGGFFRHRKPIAYKPNIVTEYILVFKKPSKNLIDKFLKNHSLVKGDYDKTNMWEFNPETKSKHSAPFPVILPQKCIKYYSYENELVLDPFMGSGTTAIAAIRENRNFIGSELNKEYFELSQNRIKKEINLILPLN